MPTARPSPKRALRRASPTTQVAVLSAIAFCILGVVLTGYFANVVQHRALSSAMATARVAAEVGVQPRFGPETLGRRLEALEVGALDAVVLPQTRGVLRRVAVLDPRGRVVYSHDHRAIGTHRLGRGVRRALQGWITAELASELSVGPGGAAENGRLIEVFVPLRYGGEVAGVAAVHLPYSAVADAARQDTRVLTAIVVAGLVVVWMLLLPIVRAASARIQRSAAENAHLAFHDVLTGLGNRRLAVDRLEEAIDAAQRGGHQGGVVIVDLDRFKEVNDTLGHHTGDELLVRVARRLAAALRPEDTIARLGGDEFAIVLPRVKSAAAAEAVLAKVMGALDPAIVLDGMRVEVRGSAGLALFPAHGEDVATLLRHADIAMYRAKATRVQACTYDAGLDDAAGERLILTGDLRDAIAGDQLRLVYQPKLDMATGRVVGTEALVRWDHPTRGTVGPDQFVRLAEETGLIAPLTDWVLSRAVEDCKGWLAQGHDVGVAVNLSALSLHEPGLVERVHFVLAQAGVDARHLTLEVTEGTVMVDPDAALCTLTRLHQSGVGVAIDDFGTGYSSLAYLQRLPITELKIDRTFVTGIGRGAAGAVIVQSAIDLGRNLGLRVVAEGVEDGAEWDELRALGCEVAQGYYISRPVHRDDIANWLGDPPRLSGLSSVAWVAEVDVELGDPLGTLQASGAR